jgi:nucleotide-binding universal stress UspA family protein
MSRPVFVVPLDGSELAERALPYAVRLAAARGGQLALIRVALGPPPSGFDWERQQVAVVDEAEAYLSRVADTLAVDRLPIQTVVPYGHAAAQIVKVTQELGAAEVVMATHGRTGLPHLLYGSVAEAVLARSRIPVLLVPARPGEAPMPPFDPIAPRMVVALDGSAFAEAALPVAREMVGPGGELILLRVEPPPDRVLRDTTGKVVAYLDQLEAGFRREATNYLDRVVGQLKRDAPGLRVSVFVRVGEPAQGIVLAAADRSADLVVMATHGRTGLRRAVLGSVAGEVVRSGATPVLLVHPSSPSGSEQEEATLAATV